MSCLSICHILRAINFSKFYRLKFKIGDIRIQLKEIKPETWKILQLNHSHKCFGRGKDDSFRFKNFCGNFSLRTRLTCMFDIREQIVILKRNILFYFYMDRFNKNSFTADKKETFNSRVPNMKTKLHFNFALLQKPKWVKTVE